MPDLVRFWFRGEVVEIDDVPATESVLHWLRLSGASRGTKEGCNQGDCGACTVALAELVDGEVRLTTANSCLLLVPMLHDKALFTVEDVGTPDRMHPVQQALVDHAGSQCGFCTPGFVMSMWSMGEGCLRRGVRPDREQLVDGLTGNLCRCTGYRPIVDAVVDATQQVLVEGVSRVRWAELRAQLTSLRKHPGNSGSRFIAPATEKELAIAIASQPDARIVAGGTDLVVAMRAGGSLLDDNATFISIAAIPSMASVEATADELVVGAAASLEDSWAALVARIPALDRMHRRFASPAIRSQGTIGGNIANSSPIADLVPVLIALDATVDVKSQSGVRSVPVAEFATGVRRNVLAPGEFVARVRIPVSSCDRHVQAHKVSRRFDDDISSVSAVFAWHAEGDRITDVRLVFGGLATTVKRAENAEGIVNGSHWDDVTVRQAQAALAQDFAPIDDHRASGAYRLQVAQGLLERWWLSMSATEDIDVWAAR